MLLYFTYNFILLLLYFLCGWVVIKIFRISLPITSWIAYFSWHSALGFVVSSILIALIFSYGKTIALSGIIPLAWFFYSLKRHNSEKQELEIINLKEVSGIVIVILLFYALNYYSPLSKLYYGDIVFRSDVSSLMLFLNRETSWFYDLLEGYNGYYVNYHYMHLWNNAIVAYLFTKKDTLSSYLYILNPALLTICILLFYSVLRTFITKVYWGLFLAIAVWFLPNDLTWKMLKHLFVALNIPLDKFYWLWEAWGISLNKPLFFNLYQIKTIHFLLIMLWGIYTFSFDKKSSTSIFGGIAPVFSPLLLTFPVSFFSYQLLTFRHHKERMTLLLIPIFILLYFFVTVLVRILNHNPPIESSLFTAFFLYPYMCESGSKLINYVLGILISVFFLGIFSWLPVLLYGMLVPKREKSPFINWLIVMMVCLCFFSILGSIFIYGNINSSQYVCMNLVFLPFISFIILSYAICVIIKKSNRIRRHFTLLLGIAVIWLGWSIVDFMNYYLSNIHWRQIIGLSEERQCPTIFQNRSLKEPIKIGVLNGFSYINAKGEKAKTFYLTMSSLGIKEEYFPNCPYRYRIVSVLLDTLPDTIRLVGYDKCLNEYYYQSLINTLPFDFYYRKLNYKIPIDSAILKYIKEQNIRYILLTNRKGAPHKSLPSYLRNLVKSFFVVPNKKDTLFELATINLHDYHFEGI